MIYEVTMYAAKCDNCKAEAFDGQDYSCWYDEDRVEEELQQMEWLSDGHNHYCSQCWSYGENDDILIDKTRFKK